jgi:hypothetical protein
VGVVTALRQAERAAARQRQAGHPPPDLRPYCRMA